jgi:hypothetical protein
MPETADLEDGLNAEAFADRYERTGSASYNRVIADIDRRVAALTLYR